MTDNKQYYLGVDIGGSHISAAFVDKETGQIENGIVYEEKVNSTGSACEITTTWQKFIQRVLSQKEVCCVQGIGLAIPGPFDYSRGISKILGVQKYESIFGLNIRLVLQKLLNDAGKPVKFTNDASGFAMGEYFAGAAKGSKRTIVVTLGTGFGSTFLLDGMPQSKGVGVPRDGYLYHCPMGKSIADDYFSTRWFVESWLQKTGTDIKGVEELSQKAKLNDVIALEIFEEFADNLSKFISPWFTEYSPDAFILGGNISKASEHFMDRLQSNLKEKNHNSIIVRTAILDEKSPLIGAAMFAKQEMKMEQEITEKRKTTQYIIPDKHTAPQVGEYDIYPGFPIGDGKIQQGSVAIAKWLSTHKTVVIDGYVGVFWDGFIKNISAELEKLGKKAAWYHVDAAMKSSADIDKMITPYLGGEDPLFGKITDKTLIDFFDKEKLEKLKADHDFDLNILVGTGASLAGWESPVVYIDLPKNELQFRMRAGNVKNLGATEIDDAKQMYKRFYFVDWRVLNEHKCNVLKGIDLIIDDQRPDNYMSMTGESLRDGLNAMAHNFFRVRPWFEPGVWGGTWIKDHIRGLNKDVENLAWSYELMVLENGILFESNGYLLEVSFDFLMYNNYKEILGDSADRFKYDFPIRYNLLDTFDGANLSVQCHPKTAYIQEKFGMPFTQDETYYILNCKDNPDVYLGFQDKVDPKEFEHALIESQEKSKVLDVERYVQKFTASKHELYLIPNGTIHASGKNNLVLEISSAPYIFTFKMYDWLRLDLDGKPRPINIEHGMNNVDFSRQGEKVREELISKPYILEKTKDFILEHLPTHKEHFYDVNRYKFEKEIQIENNDKCHVWILVEGQSVLLETQDGMTCRFNYAETFVVPAATQNYKLINEGSQPALMIKTFVK